MKTGVNAEGTAATGPDKWKFEDAFREGLYRAIFSRRDIRGQFLPDPIPDDVLSRVLRAAHHAPSVGFMQPWNFILIDDVDTKRAVHNAFSRATTQAADMFEGEKRKKYKTFKLEGIRESPVNICVTCDRERTGPVVIGRTTTRDMDIYSSVCAVQNLWLASRAEGLGVGWVSIVHKEDLSEILALPENVEPVAYLCVGYVSHFPEKPELETAKWLPRLALEDLVYCDKWGKECREEKAGLYEAIRSQNKPTRSKGKA